MQYDDLIFDSLITDGAIPSVGVFSVTEKMKADYIKLYPLFAGNSGNLKPKEVKFALKLAGLSLLKLNEKRRELSLQQKSVKSSEKTSSGIVYIVSNPAFEGYYKIGMTKDLNARMKTYQTSDPFKRFKVEHWKVVENARETEKYLLKHHSIELAQGEWASEKNVKEIFNSI